jgi:hypothetical protein
MRPPLTGTSVQLAGQGSKVGGQVARIFGWLVLGVGGTIGLGLLAFFQWLLPEGILGYLVGSPIALASFVVGYLLLRGGRKLEHAGEDKERATQHQAVFALAANRGGVVSAYDVATALSVPLDRADALLTALAKDRPDWVTLEVDDASGNMYYRVASPDVRKHVRDDELRARIDAAVAQPTRVAPADADADAATEADEADVRAQARHQA